MPLKTNYMHVFFDYMQLVLVKMMNLSWNLNLILQLFVDGQVERGVIREQVERMVLL